MSVSNACKRFQESCECLTGSVLVCILLLDKEKKSNMDTLALRVFLISVLAFVVTKAASLPKMPRPPGKLLLP